MVKSSMPARGAHRDDDTSSLAALSRTLEALETRLSKIAPVARPIPATSVAARDAASPISFSEAQDARSEPAATAPERRRPSLSDAVSEIVMRRRMLDEAPRSATPARPAPGGQPGHRGASRDGRDLGKRFESLAVDVEALRAEGGNYQLMAEVAEELQRLRQDMKAESSARHDPRFDAMRDAFDDLRRMIEDREDASVIGAELSEISASLARMTEDGADRSTLNTLRAELEELRGLFGETAKEKTLHAVGERWDAFEDRYSVKEERDSEAQRDLKDELERLRQSLHSLASEDQVRAVEKRWDDFETRYLGSGAASNETAISKLLQDELEGLRKKLDGISGAAPSKAAEARWGAIEQRLNSREVEDSILRLAERMGEIESMLGRLPESLGIAQMEERMRALAGGVEQLALRSGEADLDHFIALEERLDEISRAIVATSMQAPMIDMAPIERIEARIATLTARVDRIADEGDAEILSLRIAELSDRVEELAGNALTDQLAARIAGLADRLETAFAEIEQPSIDTAAIEQRLAALALRLEDAVKPQADAEMMRSLEAQIARLSDHLAATGSLSAADFDQDFDRRLALVEQRLEENREALISAAREAADETARRMQAAGDRRQSEHVAELSENLRSLEQLSRETDERSNLVFEKVHSTLLKIVERLEQIETEVSRGETGTARDAGDNALADRAAAHMAAAGVGAAVARAEAAPRGFRNVLARRMPGRSAQPAGETALVEPRLLDPRGPAPEDRVLDRVDAPSLDTSGMIDRSEVNRPLEPGSGAPDIGALLERFHSKQRGEPSAAPLGESETRAAAHRAAKAAKAAVAESEALRSPSAAGSDVERKFSLTELVSRRRKTILMGVTAVLMAVAAMTAGSAFLSVSGDEAAEGLTLEGSADPAPTASTPDASADVAAAPAATKPRSDAPTTAATLSPASPPQRSATVPTIVGAAAVPPPLGAQPAAAKPAGAGITSAYPSATPQGFVPKAAPSAPKTADGDVRSILASAIAKLPDTAKSAPAVPDDIGTPALVSAAKSGDPKAFFEIGLRLLEGRGGEPKPAAAVDWFAQAGKMGFAPAQYSLGTLFEKGNGVARDTTAARDWYLLAAKAGNVRAMHNLAVLYATGVDGKSEPETAATWFEKAAEEGMRDSQYNLGILYARGSGVEANLADSYKWFAIVAKAGDKDAEAKRDEIAASLSPDQLKAAEAEVAGWQPKERLEEANTVDVPKEWADAKSDGTASVDMKRAVRNIQAILSKLGYDAGTPDGVVGGKTVTAITAFQKDAGLTATGKIDETLIRALLARKDG